MATAGAGMRIRGNGVPLRDVKRVLDESESPTCIRKWTRQSTRESSTGRE